MGSMNTPAVLLFRGSTSFGAVVRWYGRGRYGHAGLRLPDGRVLDATMRWGVSIRKLPLSEWKTVEAFRVAGMGEADWDKAIEFAGRQLDLPYDYLSVMRFVTRKTSWPDDRWFCSELVFESILRAGFRLLRGVEAWAVSPTMLGLSPLLIPESG